MHIEEKLKNKESMIKEMKEQSELKLKYELLQKDVEMKKLQDEIEALRRQNGS